MSTRFQGLNVVQRVRMSLMTKPLITWISVTSGILFCCWLLYLRSIRGVFQDAHGVDPLAMIHVLFPTFWLILGGYLALCGVTLYFQIDASRLHRLLLCELALVFFWTPFLLSGFSWSPDSLFHGGIASYLPEIFRGVHLPFASYAASYPLSFILTYLVEAVTGLTIFPYSLYVYPPLCIVAFTLLTHRFITQLLGSTLAFASLLIAFPALHFLEPHVSPFSFGTLLIVTALTALTAESRRMLALFLVTTLAMVVTHPVSPLSLGIFLLTALLIQWFEQRLARRPMRTSFGMVAQTSWGLVFLLSIFWAMWTLNWAVTQYASVDQAIAKIVSLEFIRDLLVLAEFTGGGFVYANIQLLSLVIYGIIGLIDLTVFLVNLYQLWRGRQDPLLGLRLFFALSGIFFAGYGFLLYLGTGEHVLLGRGLLFFITASAVAFTIQFYHIRPMLGSRASLGLLLTLLLFLFTTFPIVSYSKEAYNTHTPTAGAGLAFISAHVDVATQSLSMGADRQLAAYSDLRRGLQLAPYPPNLTRSTPDYIALRINSYFLIAMRYDFNFENNTYTRLQDALVDSPMYSKVYTSAVFDLYASTRGV